MLLMSTFNDSEAQELPTILPTSPEAASFAKFTEVPVSHYTGVPNISVPITSFSVGNKSFPINISYHARGIQVSEIGSRVGLGWALNAGGQISRQIRNKADDGYTGYIRAANFYNNIFFHTSNVNMEQAINSANNSIFTDQGDDLLPDLFNLQVNDISTKFIFSYQDDFLPLAQKYSDLIIEGSFDTGNIGGFKVTDKDGYIYTFGAADADLTIRKYTIQANGTDYIVSDPLDANEANLWSAFSIPNAWHLVSVVSPNGERAEFDYIKEANYVYRRSSDKFNVESQGSIDQLHCNVDLVRMDQHQLKEIRYNFNPNGTKYSKIVFDAVTPREDVHSESTDNNDFNPSDVWPNEGKELNAVEIYNHNGELIKTFVLHHHYMNSFNHPDFNSFIPNYQPLLLTMNPSAHKRLILDSITEFGRNGMSKPPYKFTYNPTVLPNRHSNSKDLWGFYNGKNNGQFLAGYGADRRVDTLLAEAAMLKKITYPTGGSTRFTYEHNIGHRGAEYDSIYIQPVNPSKSVSFTLSNLAISNVTSSSYLSAPSGIFGGGIYRTAPKTINANSLVRLGSSTNLPLHNGNDQMDACVGSPNSGGPFASCKFRIRLVPLQGLPGNEMPIPGVNPIEFWSDSLPTTISAGLYWMEVHVPLGWDPNAVASTGQYFNVHLIADDQVANEDYIYAAGKRIKQIEFLDSANNVVSKKTYDYLNSGIILGLSDFSYKINIEGYEFLLTPYHWFNHYQSNTIGYKFVDEYFGDAIDNYGKRRYEFLITKDSGSFTDNPRTPPTDNEWLRGLPLKIADYKHNPDGTFTKVKLIENTYLAANENHNNVLPSTNLPIPVIQSVSNPTNPILTPETIIIDYVENNGITETTISGPSNAPEDLSDPFYNDYLFDRTDTNFRMPFIWTIRRQEDQNFILDGANVFRTKLFHFTGGTLDTGRTIETNYDDNENITLVTETETAYNYAKHYQASSVRTVTSDGEPVFQTFTYPQELVSGYSIHPSTYSSNPNTALAEQHRFVPLETSSLVDANDNGVADLNEELNKTKTIYDWDGDILEPYLIQSGKDIDPNNLVLEDRIEFKDYDEDGNLLQVKKKDGMEITYIYGYDNTLPVAKVENATYAQVTSYVSNIQSESNLDNDHCLDSGTCNEKNLRTALDALRNGLPNAMVTTYTYDPLIGVTSMTDPKGYTVYYQYDDLNRLVRVLDEDGHILSENKYNYLLDN